MQRLNKESPESTTVSELCEEYRRNNSISRRELERFDVKRGLRNADGTGVMAGLTHVCNVHGYLIDDGDKVPDKGRLTYRGIDIEDIVSGCAAEGRFGFEEVAWLLIFGELPDQRQYKRMCDLLFDNRELPEYFPEDMIIKAPSKNIMNKLARSVMALYSYDDDPEDMSLENNMRQSISLIARMPSIMAYAYQVKRRHFDKESMFFHPYEPGQCTAEAILNALRPDRQFTREEAELLDLCMVLHAEHGGGNNSTFTTRVLTSAGTDIYSAIGAAVGSLKGYRHGGANHRVKNMMTEIMENVKNWDDEDEVEAYLEKILRGEAHDGSGLIYGVGHAIYTLSDPRAVILKGKARALAKEKGYLQRLSLYETVERLAPKAFLKVTGSEKVLCANVDFYSGLVYEMLGIPEDLFTPMFAVSRIAGWCAHRIEELTTGGRIMRPAYRALPVKQRYVPFSERRVR
ncbi:citrate/2-methylcitrate synthase [Acutalibacter muris]|uniref:Citrate synthase n=1 Tax=Acutalibacter muris TaxID=1796620 RepID=A0A1Z2XT48_9FIRM|nr:citrate/2-methylcitrate synthase [Acutalibacter muris]ANU55141.1 citrate synthase [Hungateiclostridiaceae bacterium KB18]ASB41626.1 citrate synthase [Acutalibacter muris]QQR30886.1 citrate/2-methylcitrate synthase [Acutalibacter muris]